MSDAKAPSILWLALALAAVVGAAVLLAIAGVPPAGVSIAAAAVGAALVVGFTTRRRTAMASGRDPETVAMFPFRIAAERVDPDRIQPRFLPPTSRVYAAGLLCAAPGQVRFVPAKERADGRAFDARPDRVEVRGGLGRTSLVHVTSGERRARFSVNLPPDDLATHLRAYLPVTTA